MDKWIEIIGIESLQIFRNFSDELDFTSTPCNGLWIRIFTWYEHDTKLK